MGSPAAGSTNPRPQGVKAHVVPSRSVVAGCPAASSAARSHRIQASPHCALLPAHTKALCLPWDPPDVLSCSSEGGRQQQTPTSPTSQAIRKQHLPIPTAEKPFPFSRGAATTPASCRAPSSLPGLSPRCRGCSCAPGAGGDQHPLRSPALQIARGAASPWLPPQPRAVCQAQAWI